MRALATFVTLLGSVAAFGQTRDTAAIFGGVSDSQGAAIPGASVTLTSTATGQVRKTITDDSGQYLFPSLPIGSYSLAVEQPAFKTLSAYRHCPPG
jgi:hypothetical protein